MKRITATSWLLLLMSGSLPCLAATYTVGPVGRDYRQLADVFESHDLEPGDIVEVDGDASYDGGIVVGADDGGSESRPVIIRWRQEAGGNRPRLVGGEYHTIKFQQSDHVVLEGFDISGGKNSCLFSEAHDVTVRDVVIHDCAGNGILGADQMSGSFTLEYSEIFHAGEGMGFHTIYMQSDELNHPGSVFRMRFNYLHGGRGGNLVKVRHERSEIYYNWLEGGAYQVLELIGPDCWEQPDGWTSGLRREDADVVGNVLVHTSEWSNVVRIGGDLNGRSEGQVRLVDNTIMVARPGNGNIVMVQLGAGALQMDGNLIVQPSRGRLSMVKENLDVDDTPEPCSPQGKTPWAAGRQVAGDGNWLVADAQLPREWTHTGNGLADALQLVAGLPLRPGPGFFPGNGAAAAGMPAGALRAAYHPPLRHKLAPGQEQPRQPDGAGPRAGALDMASSTTAMQATQARKVSKWGSRQPAPFKRTWTAGSGG